jgi:hypothetical protein
LGCDTIKSPQNQRLLSQHLVIVPELNPVQSRVVEPQILEAKGRTHDFQGVVSKGHHSRARSRNHLSGIGVVDFDSTLRRASTFGELEEYA